MATISGWDKACLDRKKDMMNRDGLKISSAQVENAIHEHKAEHRDA